MRREHGSRAFFAAQRVVHIASHFQRNVLQAGIQAGKIRPRQLRQTAAAVADGCAVFIQQIRAQCLQHPRAAIVGGAATNAEQDFFHTVVQRRQNQFACAVAGGDERIALAGRHQMQARSRCHFNNRGFAVARNAVVRGNAVAQRRGYFGGVQRASGGINQRLHRAFAAIRHRDFDVLGIGHNGFL